FLAISMPALRQAVTTGAIAPPPPGARVPRWLRQILVRGLAGAPADRYPSMEALLSQLRARPRPGVLRRLRIAAAAGLLAIAGAGYKLFKQHERQLCSGAEREVRAVWNPQRRRGIEAAFLATGVPYAAEAVAGVTQAMDRFARTWADLHRE